MFQRLSISLKSKVILVVSLIMLVMTIITIILCYRIFYRNILKASLDAQHKSAVFISDILYEYLYKQATAVRAFIATSKFNPEDADASDILEEFTVINKVISIIIGYNDCVKFYNTNINEMLAECVPRTRDWCKDAQGSTGILLTRHLI